MLTPGTYITIHLPNNSYQVFTSYYPTIDVCSGVTVVFFNPTTGSATYTCASPLEQLSIIRAIEAAVLANETVVDVLDTSVAPTFVSISPATGAAGDDIIFYGTNFPLDTNFLIDGITVHALTRHDKTMYSGRVPQGTGQVDVTFEDSIPVHTVVLSGVFTYA